MNYKLEYQDGDCEDNGTAWSLTFLTETINKILPLADILILFSWFSNCY